MTSHLPRHPPDHMTNTSGMSMASPTQSSLAMFRLPRYPPDHVTLILAVPIPLPSEQQARVTRTCTDHSPAYITIMVDSYRWATACGQPNLRVLDYHCPPTFNFHEWEAITHPQADNEGLQYLRYGFPAGFEGPISTPSFSNHAAAINHHRNVKTYISTEIVEGAMLGPFPRPPFTPLVPD